MRKFLFILLIILAFSVRAQPRWIEGAGGKANDEALDLRIDKNGNVLTTGYFSFSSQWNPTSSTPIIKNSKGFDDIFVSKQNAQGICQWVQSAGGISPDRAYAITEDKWGNIYITGYFSQTANFGPFTVSTTSGLGNDIDVFVAKLDAAGNFIWVKSFGGPDAETGYGITTDLSGNILFCGQFKDTFNIGTNSFVSMKNPLTGNSSGDIFIAKLDSSGNVLWAKQGSAKYDDRGIDISVDSKNNVYMVGEFSDTLTFTNTYNNSVFGSGYLIKLDSLGNEVWFRKMSATQSISYAIESNSSDQIYVAGEFKGQLGIFSPTPAFLNIPYTNGIFLTKIDTAGNVIWVKGDGSNNFVTATNLALDNIGQPYIVGMYKCRMDEYSSLYGSGIFYSVGYRDVFIVKYSDIGIRQWVRTFGGPADDYSSAIGLLLPDRPVIAGSYEDKFWVPSSIFIQPFSYINGLQCGDANYNRYVNISSKGNKDIFYTNAIDLTREPYDYFKRNTSSGCFLDSLAPCIAQCQDSIMRCSFASFCVDTKTTEAGPYYNYFWNTGRKERCDTTYKSGQFIVTMDRRDGCWTNFKDTINVIVNPYPPTPAISDNVVINTNTQIPKDIVVCSPDTVYMWTTNHRAGDSIVWSGPGFFSNDTIVAVTKTGTYTVTYYSPYGCIMANLINVYFDDFAHQDTLNPFLIFNSYPYHQDSVEICQDSGFFMTLIDSAFIVQNGWKIPYKWVLWSATNGLLMAYDSTHANYNAANLTHQHTNGFSANSSGWYTITANLINVCNNDTSYYPISKTIYVTVNPKPIITAAISGSSIICPGDTLMLSVNYTGQLISWLGPEIISNPQKDTIYITGAGIYYVQVDSTNQFGCMNSILPKITVKTKPTPEIYTIPSNGIVCPNDSVQLVAKGGIAWQWVGPGGYFLAATQTIYAESPGFYYCIVTDSSGCTMLSNFVELKNYQTPYLVAFPGNTICANGIIKIQVQTVDSSLIVWNPPLSGSGATQFVTGPGVYSCSITLCGITTNLSITITPSNTQAQITVQGSLPICAGDTIVLSANSGMQTYQWSPGGQIQQQIFVTKPGTYHLQVMDQFGCYAGDTVVISQHPITPKPTVKDTTICFPASVTLTANGLGTVNWYSQQSGGSTIATGSFYTTPIISVTTTYWVENVDNTTLCASERVPVKIILSPVMTSANISGDSIVCEGDKITLFANNIPGAFYSWTGPNGFVNNQQNFTLLSSSVNQQGWYYVSISDSFCVGPTDSFFVAVNPTPVIKLKNPGIYFICPGDSLQIFADTLSGGTYNWFGWISNNNNIVVDSTGIYYVSFTDANGCVGYSDSVTVAFYPTPALSYLSSDTVVCSSGSITLSANGNGSITWFDSAGTLVGIGNNYTTPPIVFNTFFLVQMTDSVTGCKSIIDTIFIYYLPSNLMPPIYGDTSLCVGDSLKLWTINYPNAQFFWTTPQGSFSNYLIGFSNITLTYSGNYSLYVTSGTCTSLVNSIYINVYNNPSPPVLNVSDTVCQGSAILLSTPFLQNFSYQWFGPNYSSNNPIDSLVNAQYFDRGYYILELTQNGCSTKDSAFVEVIGILGYNVSASSPICEGDDIYLQVTYAPGATYSWTGPNGFSSNLFNPIIQNSSSSNNGVYVVTTNYLGCSIGPDSIVVNVDKKPVLNLPDDTTFCFGLSIQLNATPGYQYYLWNTGDTSAQITVSDSGTYYVFIVNGSCYAYDSAVVHLKSCPSISANIFTPNGDGVNDFFKIDSPGATRIMCTIYNRWGDIIYKWDDVNGKWNGKTILNIEAAEGVYFYVAEIKNVHGIEETIKGFVHLNR